MIQRARERDIRSNTKGAHTPPRWHYEDEFIAAFRSGRTFCTDGGARETSTIALCAHENSQRQGYLPHAGAGEAPTCKAIFLTGAGEASTSKAIFPTLALANADVQSYLAYFGAHEAPTCKAIFPTLALAKPRPAKLSSIRWRWQTPTCKAIFPTLALGRHRLAKLSSRLWRWATPRLAKEKLYF